MKAGASMFFYRPLKLRAKFAHRYATELKAFANDASTVNTNVTTSSILDALNASIVVDYDEEIIVTEVGFVTMALLPSAASYEQELLVIPGVDDHAQRGYLVLRTGHPPYHSLALDAVNAAAETRQAHSQADELVNHFGSRSALKQATLSAPWYLISRIEDVVSAGLCTWGSNSFLRRYGLFRIGHSVGLPRIALRLAGSYGNRITAATLRRHNSSNNSYSSYARAVPSHHSYGDAPGTTKSPAQTAE